MPLGRYNRRDAKNLSKNRFSRLDADIASSYVDDEEEERPRPKQGTVTRVINMLAGRPLHGQVGTRRGKKDEQTLRSAAGVSRNTEMVYKIRIPSGRKLTVPWIMKQLHQQIEDIKPLLVSITPRGDVEFFLKSEDSADACRAISRRIVHRVLGDRMSIIVDKVVAPWTRLNKEETAVIQTVVDSRYNHELRSLDLSEFALDQQFKDRDLHMMLNKNNVMLTVVDRIDEKFGYITALSLQGNRLRFLDYAAVLTSVTKFLKVLDLSNNQIDKVSELEKLKGLPVETLFFEGNPLVEQLTTASGYLSAVHQVFPNVCVLDGAPVQPATVHVQSLDDDEVTCEPPCRAGFYGSDSLRVLVERFLVEYFKLYDGEDGAITRKSLMQAYDQDNSTFTLTIANLKDMPHEGPIRYPNDACYNTYIRASHNVLYEDRWSRNRSSLTYRGAMDIAVALSRLPVTNHYTESFIVDTHLISEELMAFCVQGLFEDGKFAKPDDVPQLNFFARSFLVSPRGNESIAVLSDMLYISGITSARMARYKIMLNKAVSAGQLPSTSIPMNSVLNAAESIGVQMSSQLTVERKMQMVEQFCKDSGMLAAWSEKCLMDYDWNYIAAGQAFLSNKNNIPKEAFASLSPDKHVS
ncbi:TAP protein [Dictyocaulus viviparus]|uniref:TAP protein n=1 Tax=Dictyocaulus viviparus TaxID=29172 RepID=A0A0D8XXH2_DICVI|nr:TAP protein [Dictyocaulus viviparus]